MKTRHLLPGGAEITGAIRIALLSSVIYIVALNPAWAILPYGEPDLELDALGVSTDTVACWQMFRNDARHSGKSLAPGPVVPALKWRYGTGGNISSSAAISGTGTVYVGSEDGLFYSLSSTGVLLWSYETAQPILSSPAISTDTVYIGSDDSRLYCIIDRTGKLSWSYTTGGNISSSPTLSATETVYVGSEDGTLYSLNSAGLLIWSYETAGPILSSPAISTDTVFVGSDDNRIYCIINVDGDFSWSYLTGGNVFSSPALNGTDMVYVGSEDGTLYSLSPAGALLWSYAAEPILSSLAISTETVYMGSDDNRIYCLIDKTGRLSWSYETGGNVFSSPALSGTDTAYVGSEDGILYSINSNGSLAWTYATDDSIESSVAISTDTVYVGSNDNFLYVLVGITPATTPTPTDTPTPTPTPPLSIDPGEVTAGQYFSIYLALAEDITQPFDFYLLVESPAGVYTIYFNGSVGKGITPLYRNVPRFSAPFSATINSAVRVPLSMAGKTVTFYTAVIDAGKIPPVKKLSDLTPDTPYVIMMDKQTVTIGS